MSDRETAELASGERRVFADVCDMIAVVLDDVGVAGLEIGMQSQLLTDLGMQSIDLVELSVQLQDHYGKQVNLTGFLTGFEIIELTVGQLVRHVASLLADTEES